MQRPKWLSRRWLLAILALLILFYEARIITGIVQSIRIVPRPVHTDVAIVLGAAVWQDQPSPVFAARIDHALDLLADGTVQQIILTGGLGSRDHLAEATAGARYAMMHGANAAALRCETISRTTWGNLVAATAIMQQEKWQTATIVSDPLHIYRATHMAQDLNLHPQPGPTPHTRYQSWNSQLPFLLREWFFVHQYQVQRLLPLLDQTITTIDGRCDL